MGTAININNLGPPATAQMSATLALVTGLVKSIPNEEFGVLARWMTEEANRRRDHVREKLKVGVHVVWVNTTGKMTQGEVVELGSKNAKIRSQHGGELFVPLARLELAEVANARLSSLPPSLPPPIPSVNPLAASGPKAAKPRSRKKSSRPEAA
jgi:uncharacterized protein YwbE